MKNTPILSLLLLISSFVPTMATMPSKKTIFDTGASVATGFGLGVTTLGINECRKLMVENFADKCYFNHISAVIISLLLEDIALSGWDKARTYLTSDVNSSSSLYKLLASYADFNPNASFWTHYVTAALVTGAGVLKPKWSALAAILAIPSFISNKFSNKKTNPSKEIEKGLGKLEAGNQVENGDQQLESKEEQARKKTKTVKPEATEVKQLTENEQLEAEAARQAQLKEQALQQQQQLEAKQERERLEAEKAAIRLAEENAAAEALQQQQQLEAERERKRLEAEKAARRAEEEATAQRLAQEQARQQQAREQLEAERQAQLKEKARKNKQKRLAAKQVKDSTAKQETSHEATATAEVQPKDQNTVAGNQVSLDEQQASLVPTLQQQVTDFTSQAVNFVAGKALGLRDQVVANMAENNQNPEPQEPDPEEEAFHSNYIGG